ncbi:hypothetical protein KR200_007307 [Drosophila serrata]|nr:hypothetical protein KR200_007307 [Drosophila serrata]
MQWKKKFTRLKAATGNSRVRRMLCCGRRKENGRSVPDVTASPGRAPPGPLPANQLSSLGNQQQQQMHHQGNQQQHHHHQGNQQHHGNQQQHHGNHRGQSGGSMSNSGGGGVKDPVMLQGDFRKVSGISSEIFRQIEAVENDHDPNTAAALEAVERRGEMIVRILEPRCMGSKQAVDAAHKLMNKADGRHTVQLVEIVKRPGQTLGLYIREGNGADRTDGVFISRIALESAVYNSGCLRVGDEILAVNLVDVTHMSLDDVVIIMSIPRRLVLAIRQRRGNRGTGSPGPPTLSRPEQKPPPVVVIKRDLRDEDLDETDRMPRPRSSRERRTGRDGREMTESRSRLGLGLNNYSPQSEQLDMYYNTRGGGGGGGGGGGAMGEPPNWGYKPPPPPSSVITEQPTKGHAFAPSHAYYQNAGTLESLAEKVHAFYPGQPGGPPVVGPSRRMSTGTGNVGLAQQHARFPRSGSDQHLPRVEYADYSNSLGRHSLLRSSLKPGTAGGAPMPVGVGGTLGRYGRYDQQRGGVSKYGPPAGGAQSLTRRSRPNLDYSSDTEATIGPRPSYYYYNRPAIGSMPRGAGPGPGSAAAAAAMLAGTADLNKFNSLPRERPGVRLGGIRSRMGDRLVDENDGNTSAPEFDVRRGRDLRQRITASPSIFTADEYRAWLRRAPSSSAIAEQMRMTRDMFAQPRAQRFSCSAENIHDALRNTESIYSSRTHILGTGTLDRNMGLTRPISALPVRSMSSQHIGGAGSIRSPSIRRMRQLLELSAGPASPSGSIMSTGGHQSPAPTPSATLPRQHRQIDINPAEFAKYKLDKPIVDIGGVSGMLWIHLLAGRSLRTAPEGASGGAAQPGQTRDLYCVIECDRVHKARTVVRSGDLQFDWDESFELDLVGNKQLDVLVYSWDPQHRHKLCYRGAISLSAILRQSPLHQLALKVEPRGTIYIRMRHTDPLALYKRRGLSSLRAGYPTLFGADLETVVNRESKGAPGCAPVPIVLRRCVEEVERRGLDIIGLYRLCGSATKKRLLREAFERNSRAVELSPEHVPDINVITGVLKDYLRELPEPLFTRCLFQMTVDALAVCLPDDPEGNAKLMLSILDCLPRANRATLVFLLDHLSLVVSNSERNKMSAQALATVMGPPLMLHSASAQPGADIDHAQPIAVLKYLLQIWPQPQAQHQQMAQHMGGAAGAMMVGGLATAGSMSNMAGVASGRRGESTGQRGSKVSALPADRQALLLQQQAQLMAAGNLLRSSTSVTNILSQGHPQLSATANSHLYQSVVGQLAQSHRALQQAVQQPYQLGASVGSAIPDQSPLPLPGTPSPGSSSASTGSGSGSGSGSGTDTIKRGASPVSVKQVKIIDQPSSPYSIVQKKPPLQKDAPIEITTPTTQADAPASGSSIRDRDSSNGGTTARKSNVDFYEPHKSLSKSLVNEESSYSSKYSSSLDAAKKSSSYGNGNGYTPSKSNAGSSLSTGDDYKAMRNKSSATSSSSSSQATVLSAGSTATSAPTTSSDDSDDLVSYKSSASTNALLAQSQAMTTSQLMSKYLKREPRVQFTPIKSPDSPSPPGGGDGLPKGTYQLVAPSTSSSASTKPGATTGAISKYTTSSADSNVSTNSQKQASPSRVTTSKVASSTASSSLVSTGRRLFDSLASSSSSETETKTYIGASSSSTTYNNDTRHSGSSSSKSGMGGASGTGSGSGSGAGSEHRSYGSTLFGSSGLGNGNGSHNHSGINPSPFTTTNGNGNHNTMHLYGTLPKNGTTSTGAALFGSSSASSSSYHSSSGAGTASSSGVSSMTGSTNSYDFYTSTSSSSSSSRPFANGGNNYHTLGTYRAQYAATNPFLDAFDEKPSEKNGSGSSSSHQDKLGADKGNHHRATVMAAFQSSGDSKNGSDEYDDLK